MNKIIIDLTLRINQKMIPTKLQTTSSFPQVR
jgi:hypothetical protein